MQEETKSNPIERERVVIICYVTEYAGMAAADARLAGLEESEIVWRQLKVDLDLELVTMSTVGGGLLLLPSLARWSVALHERALLQPPCRRSARGRGTRACGTDD